MFILLPNQVLNSNKLMISSLNFCWQIFYKMTVNIMLVSVKRS